MNHKHLLPLIGTKALDELPRQILKFQLTAQKLLITVNTLSPAPVEHTVTQAEDEQEAVIQIYVYSIRWSFPATEDRLQQLAEEQTGLTKPSCRLIRPYWKKRQNLSLAGDVLLKGQRIHPQLER